MDKIKSADYSIVDTISELAVALTRTGDFSDWPEKLKAISAKNPVSCKRVGLKVVADLIEAEESLSSGFKTYLANFVQALFAIARASDDKDGVRQMVVEVLLCIVENCHLPKYLSIKEFASDLVRILLEIKLKVENGNSSDDEENAESDAESEAEEDAEEEEDAPLTRVADEIGEENVKEIIFGYVSEYLKKDEWRYRAVAIMAIAETAESLPDKGVETLLDEIVETLKVQLNDPHWSVRYATLLALGVLATKYQTLFQENYIKAFLPLLVNLFGDLASFGNSVVDVKSIAGAAFAFKIMTKGETEAAKPFPDQWVKDFLEQVKPENSKEVRERCIRGMLLVAVVTRKKFMKYYSVVVPVIKRIIVAPSTDEEGEIREAAIKCFKKISDAVKDKMIQADADEVAQVLLRPK